MRKPRHLLGLRAPWAPAVLAAGPRPAPRWGRARAALAVVALLGLVAAGCGDPDLRSHDGPTTIRVSLEEGTLTGCELAPDGERLLLPYTNSWYNVRVTMELLDAAGDVQTDYQGRVRVRMMPGEVNSDLYKMKDGAVRGALVQLRASYGHNSRIWVETLDEGGGSVAGVSPGFCFENPRLRDLQESDRSYHSPMEDQQVFVDHGTLIATGISKQGFYVTDVSGCSEKPEWSPEAGGSRIDCDTRRQWTRVQLVGTEAVQVPAPRVLGARGIEVLHKDGRRDKELEPYRVDEDYVATVQEASSVTVQRVEGGAIADGEDVLVQWVANEHALSFASLFVFTFSAPFGVIPGTRFCSLQGGVTEFLGLTELGFPSYRVYLEGGAEAATPERPYNDEEVPDPRDDETFVFFECPLEDFHWSGVSYIPDPVRLYGRELPGAEIPVYDDKHMVPDRWEAGLVRVENVRMPLQWRSCDLDGSRQVDRCYDRDREEGRCLPNQMAENDCEMACTTAGKTGLRTGESREDYAGCTELTNYDTFGQYLVQVVDVDADGRETTTGRLNMTTRENVPEFDPRPRSARQPYGRLYPDTDQERLVRGFKSVTGELSQINGARPVWLIIPRSIDDIEFDFVDSDQEQQPQDDGNEEAR